MPRLRPEAAAAAVATPASVLVPLSASSDLINGAATPPTPDATAASHAAGDGFSLMGQNILTPVAAASPLGAGCASPLPSSRDLHSFDASPYPSHHQLVKAASSPAAEIFVEMGTGHDDDATLLEEKQDQVAVMKPMLDAK